MSRPAQAVDPPHERFVPQAEFCRKVGISVPLAQKLRREKILPSMGGNPVYIPLVAGSEAVLQYCRQSTSE